MSYEITWEARGAHLQFYGQTSAPEIFAATQTFYTDERAPAMHYRIIDFRGVTSHSIGSDDIPRFSTNALDQNALLPTHRVALVAVDPEIIDLCFEFFDHSVKLNSKWAFQVFSRLEDARAWVELA